MLTFLTNTLFFFLFFKLLFIKLGLLGCCVPCRNSESFTDKKANCFLSSPWLLNFSSFFPRLESGLITDDFYRKRIKTRSNFFTLPLNQFLIFNSLNMLEHKLSIFAELQFCAIH